MGNILNFCSGKSASTTNDPFAKKNAKSTVPSTSYTSAENNISHDRKLSYEDNVMTEAVVPGQF